MAEQQASEQTRQAREAYLRAKAAYDQDPSPSNQQALNQATIAYRDAAVNEDRLRAQEFFNSLGQGNEPNTAAVNRIKQLLSGLEPNLDFAPGAGLGKAEEILQLIETLGTGGLGQLTPEQQALIQDAQARATTYVTNNGGTAPAQQPEQPGVNQVPDPGVRPVMQQPGLNAPYGNDKTQKTQYTTVNDVGAEIAAPPGFAPLQTQTEYWQFFGGAGQPQDESTTASIAGVQGQSVTPGASDSVQTSQQVMSNALRQSPNMYLFRGGQNYNVAKRSGSLIFTGYATRQQKRVYDDGQVERATLRTPQYQQRNALTLALGQPGFPSIATFQQQMGLPVTGVADDNTMKAWGMVLDNAAINAALGNNVTIGQVIANEQYKAALAARQARAAMAAAYNVDPTASAAILGANAKNLLGRLSTPQEDKAFHSAFNSANISSQGKVDANQFARDWIRKRYPTEAGTMMAQDYYGAMYDVLVGGPGSLGSSAADIDG